MDQPHLTYGGFCDHCQKDHLLPGEPVLAEAQRLITKLESDKTLLTGQPEWATDHLFGTARGQMFGVMLARDGNGKDHWLKAFSGQFMGQYELAGWVLPIFDLEQFHALNTPREKEIKILSQQLDKTTDPIKKQSLKQKRRALSRALMKQIHDLYLLRNFHGKQRPMAEFFPHGKGMPTGAGDCCAPKLIQHAICNGLTPIGMAEFYFGLENKSQSRQHGQFYSSCTANCAPILGFMLCGLEK